MENLHSFLKNLNKALKTFGKVAIFCAEIRCYLFRFARLER